MNTQATLDQMRELRLHGMADSYEAVMALPVNSQPGAHQLIAQLVQHETESKQRRRIRIWSD